MGAMQHSCECPDKPFEFWFGTGSILGILEPITLVGFSPLCPAPAEAKLVDENFGAKGNCPLFGLTHGDDPRPPELTVLGSY